MCAYTLEKLVPNTSKAVNIIKYFFTIPRQIHKLLSLLKWYNFRIDNSLNYEYLVFR